MQQKGVNIVQITKFSVEEEKQYSIDEMMIPYKGTRAGSRRQYIQKKPTKWDFKVFVRCGVSGIVYDFIIYAEDDTFTNYTFSDEKEIRGMSDKVIHALCQSIADKPCSVVFFDNYFCQPGLIAYLRNEKGILAPVSYTHLDVYKRQLYSLMF